MWSYPGENGGRSPQAAEDEVFNYVCLLVCLKRLKEIQNIENLMPFHFILIFQNYTCVIITIWK